MIQIRALGGLDIRGTDRNQLRSVLAQPRRAALLVYLCVRSDANARGFLERRDALTAMFWPDADPSAARRSLRQAIAFLRRELGDDIFIASTESVERGDETIGVDPAAADCDANVFQQLIDAGESARAAELYAGDFLASFESTGIAAF